MAKSQSDRVSEYHARFAEQLIAALEKGMALRQKPWAPGQRGPAAELLDGSELPGRQRDAPGDSGAGAGLLGPAVGRLQSGRRGGRACPEGGEGHARPTCPPGRLCTEALVRPLGDYVPGGRVDAMRRLIGGR